MTPGRTLAILLGSSEYPNDPANNKAFMRDALRQSHDDFLAYLTSAEGMGVARDNVCDQFGFADDFLKQQKAIRAFLTGRAELFAAGEPVDLIIFFWGHGYFHDRRFHLALKIYEPGEEDTTGYPIASLAKLIRRHAQSARRYWLLDCCYADGAVSAALDAQPTTPEKRTKSLLGGDVVASGSATLTAADQDSKAWVFRDDKRSLFTDLLMSALVTGDGPPEILNLQQVEQRMQAILGERLGDKVRFPHYHGGIVMPRCTDPDRARGVVSKVPLFPRLKGDAGPSDRASASAVATASGRQLRELLALDRSVLACLLVGREDGDKDFAVETRSALSKGATRIAKMSGRPFRTGEHVKQLDVAEAFRDWTVLLGCVSAMCRADVVVFDVTDFQPGIMLLLGIRSVARRGVTVCTLSSTEVEDYRAALPYCLQVLNVCSHSREGPGQRLAIPSDIIADKIIEGLTLERDNPFYLDLPSFDAVRRFGVNLERYRPIPYESQVLFLCPFSPAYLEACWTASIERFFKVRLIERHRELAQVDIDPDLRRLLDRNSPQVVSQSLYEAVRRTQMCIADWTNLRPNLFFELGVRLASNPLGAIHIVADGKPKTQAPGRKAGTGKGRGTSDRSMPGAVDTGTAWGVWPCDQETAGEVRKHASLAHVAAMRERFGPIAYTVASDANEPYDRMIDRYFDSVDPIENDDNRIYATVGRMPPDVVEPAVRAGIAETLVQNAAMVDGSDAFNNFSAVLHADVSAELRRQGEAGALEHMMAAWLYMHGRYSAEEIAADPARFLQFESLHLDIALRGRSQFPEALLARVAAGHAEVVSRRPALPVEPFALLELRVRNLIRTSKLLKIDKDYRGAMRVLSEAIDLLDRSRWRVNAATRLQLDAEECTVARLLTDAVGMIGGYHRRLGEPDQALLEFERGRALERNPAFRIESTYNSVNWLVTKLELDPAARLADDIGSAIGLLERHTKGSRNRDGWAWADLGTCQAFLGRIEDAKQSLRRFIQLSNPSDISSPLRVIEAVHEKLLRADQPMSASTAAIIAFLREHIRPGA